jgi:hypothetical protein
VLVPAAICCQKSAPEAGVKKADCCPAGSHPGQVCPMHASRSTQNETKTSDCQAQPLTDLHDLFAALTSSGVMPPLGPQVPRPAGAGPAPATNEISAHQLPAGPLGPPPRS